MSEANKIRMSPSGPIIGAPVGPGFIVQQKSLSSAIDTAYRVSGNTPIELKADPSTALAPFVRPELENVNLQNNIVVEARLPIEVTDSWSSAVVNLITEYSVDSGDTWVAQVGVTSENCPGVVGRAQNTMSLTSISVARPAHSFVGLLNGAKLMVRALFSKDAGPDDELIFNSRPGTAPPFVLSIREEKA